MPKPKGGSLLTSLDRGSCDDATFAVQLFQHHLQASLCGLSALLQRQVRMPTTAIRRQISGFLHSHRQSPCSMHRVHGAGRDPSSNALY